MRQFHRLTHLFMMWSIYVWNKLNWGCRWKWRMIIAVNFPIEATGKKKPEKKSGLQRASNPWPPRYRCDALPTELWSHTLGTRSGRILFVLPKMWSKLELSLMRLLQAKFGKICQWTKKIKDAVVYGWGTQIFPKSPKENKNSLNMSTACLLRKIDAR